MWSLTHEILWQVDNFIETHSRRDFELGAWPYFILNIN
jgi:hypothetical protein